LLSSKANFHFRTENLLSHHSKFSIIFITFPITDRKIAIRNRKLEVGQSKLLIYDSKFEVKYRNSEVVECIV